MYKIYATNINITDKKSEDIKGDIRRQYIGQEKKNKERHNVQQKTPL